MQTIQTISLDQSWTQPGSKHDLRGVYQRGDVVAPSLPVRRHHDWVRKGFTFVSLAAGADVAKVADELRARGVDLGAISPSYLQGGDRPFDVQRYLAERSAAANSQEAR